jgi:hypothetical protein
MTELVKNEYGVMKAEAHVCDFGGRPLSRLNHVKGYNGPVEEWVCSCGVRRVTRAGAGPNLGDCREAAYNHFLDISERWLTDGTGQMGCGGTPAMWLTQQQEKSNG